MNWWSPRVNLVAVVIATCTLLAAANSYLRPLSFPDETDYWTLATNLVHTGSLSFNGVDPSAYRPPLVAWLLAPLVQLGISLAVARPIFVVLYAASGALVGLFLCRIFHYSRWIPALGVAFVLGNPLYFFAAGNLYPQQILAPLFLAALVLACRRTVSMRALLFRSVTLGVLAALSLLASAPALFWFAPIVCLLAWEDLQSLRSKTRGPRLRFSVMAITLVVCVGPYVLRNARDVHPGIYLSLNSGINLLLGNSLGTTPTSGVAVDLSGYRPTQPNESEYDSDRRLTQSALANIRTNPRHYESLYFRKFLAGFSNRVETVTHGKSAAGTWVLECYMALVWLGVGILFLALFFGTQRRAGDGSPAVARLFFVLILSAYLLTILGYSVFFMRLRFRLPVDLPMALGAVIGWALLASKRLRREPTIDLGTPVAESAGLS